MWPHTPPSALREGWPLSLDSRTFYQLPSTTFTYLTPTLEPEGLGVNPDSATDVLSDPEKVTGPL